MSMLSRQPFDEGIPSLQEQVNRLFGSLLGEHLVGRGTGREAWVPLLDAIETPETFEVHLEAPGVDPSGINISVTGDQLEITGAKEVTKPSEESKWYHLERSGGAFRRTITLPVPVEADQVEANSRHGLLTIRLPKKAEVMPKRISVKINK